MRLILTLLTALSLTSCTMIDTKVDVIENFTVNNYLGTWYEIARLDHSFERDMDKVTATYQLDADKVLVTNRGYNVEKQAWKEANGKAYFIEGSDKGLLKVSFFGPFYGAYQIHDAIQEVNGRYSEALVIGPDNSYAWILSRNKQITPETRQRFVMKMENLGIQNSDIIWVNQQE